MGTGYSINSFLCSLKFFVIQDVNNYCATLAHKTNHSFQPNSQFIVFEHPMFGSVPAIMTIRDVQKEEEVALYYSTFL